MNPLMKVLLACVLLAPSTFAHAEDRDDWLRGRLFPPDVVMKHQSALELTDAQRKAIRAELTALQGKVATVDWDIMEAGLEMQELISRHPVDRAVVLARAERVFEAENRKKRAWLEMLVNIKNQLTPEQVAYLARVAAAEPPR